jgi:hypothetical protein
MAVSCRFCAFDMSNNTDQTGTNAAASVPASEALEMLVAALRQTHGDAINAVLFYGSCMRSNDPFDGIVDLYLLTDSYRGVYASRWQAVLNWLLPPNVFYRELAVGDRKIRVKYNLLSTSGLRSGLSLRRIHSYFWGRFSQPIEILWARDDAIRADLVQDLQQAVNTFLTRVLPRVAPRGTVADLWAQGLALSYAAELRTEAPERGQELVALALDHYVSVTRLALPALCYSMFVTGEGVEAEYTATVSTWSRWSAYWGWLNRRILGKFLSVARLLKAFFTFEGGLDYVAWKLERHSGQAIDIPDRLRKYPLIFVWPWLWKLYRRGVIR